jgi:WD40 repeat protein
MPVCVFVDNILRVWDVDQNHATPHLALRGHTDKITDIVWQLGDLMASASWDGSIRLWDLAKGAHVEEIRTGAAPDFPTSMDDGSFAQLCYSKNTNSAEKPTGSVVAFPSPCLVARSEQGAVKIWLR